MGPQDDDGSGVTPFAALRAVPEYPATTATATATAPTNARSDTLLLTFPPRTRFPRKCRSYEAGVSRCAVPFSIGSGIAFREGECGPGPTTMDRPRPKW